MPSSSRQSPIVITGASGFVGQHVIRTLQLANVQLDHITAWSRLPASGASIVGVRTECVDITNADNVADQIKKIQPSAILHLAGISEPKKVKEDFDSGWKVNFEGVRNIAIAIKAYSPKTRLVFAGSSEVYGESFNSVDAPITELERLRPRCQYGVTKACADILLDQISQQGLDFIRIRAFNHTGPGQRPNFVVPSFAQQIARIEVGLQPPTILVGNLTASRDFLDVRDVARAYTRCLLSSSNGEQEPVFNLSSGRSVRIQDILDQLLSLSEFEISIKTDPNRLRTNEVPIAAGSNKKFCDAFGWRPEIGLQKTLQDCLDDYRSQAKKEAAN